MKFFPFVLGAVIFLAGCQGSALNLKDDALFQQTIPVCSTDEECETLWNAARQWVKKATPQGLEIDTAEHLQTRPADDESFLWETDITVSKVPMGEGRYQIVMEVWCNTAINSCNSERQLMRQFNKDMAAYVSSSQSQEILRVFTEGDDIDALFGSYATALTEAGLRQHAQKYYLPTTIISGDSVRQLNSSDEVIEFLRQSRARIGDGNITRIEAGERQLLSGGGNTAIMKLQWDFYDANDEPLYSQKASYTLIKIGEAWKIMSVSLHD